MTAAILACLTLALILVRPDCVRLLSSLSSGLYALPLLSALALLPVTTPLLLFWVECVGTSRILARVHPLASNQRSARAEPRGASEGGAGRTGADHQSARSDVPGGDDDVDGRSVTERPPTWLLARYLLATAGSRLFTKSLLRKVRNLLDANDAGGSLLSIPPASLHLLEKLGVTTCLALVDDELACEPFSTPQQLLIPGGQGGLKLLDICPALDGDEECSSSSSGGDPNNNSHNRLFDDSDGVSTTDSDDTHEPTRYAFNHGLVAPTAARTLRRLRRTYRTRRSHNRRGHGHGHGGGGRSCGATSSCAGYHDEDDDAAVQFEDPAYWQYLPSLKCIGLGCLLVEGGTRRRRATADEVPESGGGDRGGNNGRVRSNSNPLRPRVSFELARSERRPAPRALTAAESSLIGHICHDERKRKQLRLLADCIGFDTGPNRLGPDGDLTGFKERGRCHVVSADLLRQRMELDGHALGLEESRNWSRLFTDADTVFVRDGRSGGDLILTVGDSRVVTVS